MEENTFRLIIEKGGYNLTEQPELGIVEFDIDEGELDYIMQQIKFNQPFVIIVDDDIIAISPSQCVSIRISNNKKEK